MVTSVVSLHMCKYIFILIVLFCPVCGLHYYLTELPMLFVVMNISCKMLLTSKPSFKKDMILAMLGTLQLLIRSAVRDVCWKVFIVGLQTLQSIMRDYKGDFKGFITGEAGLCAVEISSASIWNILVPALPIQTINFIRRCLLLLMLFWWYCTSIIHMHISLFSLKQNQQTYLKLWVWLWRLLKKVFILGSTDLLFCMVLFVPFQRHLKLAFSEKCFYVLVLIYDAPKTIWT